MALRMDPRSCTVLSSRRCHHSAGGMPGIGLAGTAHCKAPCAPSGRRLPPPARASISPGGKEATPQRRGPRLRRGPAPAPAAVIEADFVQADTPEGKVSGSMGEGEPEEKTGSGSGKFVWQQAWYPVGIVEDFDPKVPAAVTVYGTPLVVWYERNLKEWRVFHDLCPHRLAPLSEGRIHESGHIQCSYHGWTFRADGGCSLIPQADPDRPEPCSSPKACARVYPSKVHQGILWVWPQLGAEAAALAQSTPIPTIPEHSDPAYHLARGQYDLDYTYELLVENLADPAHVPFAHHKIQGNRERGGPLNHQVERLALEGIVGVGGMLRNFAFHPPCVLQSSFVLPPKGKAQGASSDDKVANEKAKERVICIGFYCIPTTPGKSRLIFSFGYNFLPPIARRIPRWFTHLNNMLLLESDHYLLHVLDRRLQEEGGQKEALAAYYTPTRSDAFVLAFRRWLDQFGGSGVQWPEWVDPSLPPEMPKNRVSDRQKNHVSICQTCTKAQKWMETVSFVFKAAAFALLALTTVSSIVRPGALPASLGLVAVGCSTLLAAASAWLTRFVSKTYFYRDYVHALVD